MKRDRYVARAADEQGGSFTTPLLKFDGGELTLNLEATHGEVRVQVLDEAEKPIEGFTLADCEPIRGDSLATAVKWKGGKSPPIPFRMEFLMRNARLFAIQTR